jgi:hypothetical protein
MCKLQNPLGGEIDLRVNHGFRKYGSGRNFLQSDDSSVFRSVRNGLFADGNRRVHGLVPSQASSRASDSSERGENFFLGGHPGGKESTENAYE